MKLICERSSMPVETAEKNGVLYIEGIFMQAERKNRNGRIYEKAILERAVDKYVNEQVKTRRALGEMDHPDGPSVNLSRASHLIESLVWKGNDVIGKAKVLETTEGKNLSAFIKGGVQLGVSSRGMGSLVQREGVDYVGSDFFLSTVDVVQDPSAPSAFVNGIMEGVEWVLQGSTWVPKKTAQKQSMSAKVLALESFLARLT
jgi:hypothetical protein